MFIRNFDFLSPEITLYFEGRYKHSSVVSGIITIISYLIILVVIIYYILDFIDRRNPTIYFFNRYVENAGIFPLNESSLFHYLSLISTGRNRTIEYDFNSIRIYGINRGIDTYINNFDYTQNKHWEYGLCNYVEDISYKKLNKIIDKNIFSHSVCIKKYYNPEEKRYYNKGESGFVWPTLEYGVSNPNRTIYGIVIETCQNNSIYNKCNSIEKVESFFQKYAISFNFIDHYADVLNYNEPFTDYINSITDGLTIATTTISVNNVNFHPSLTRTHDGIFFENLVEEKSYSLTQNEKLTVNQQGKNTVCAFYFWMQNNMAYNERHYKKFQDILSNIGGLGSFILLIGFFINSLVSSYVILLDTQDLIFKIEGLNYSKYNKIRKSITLLLAKEKEKEKQINFQMKNENKNKVNNTPQNSKFSLFMNDKNENEKGLESGNLFNINKNKLNNEDKHSYVYPVNNKILTEYKNENPLKKIKSISDNRLKTINFGKTFLKIKDKNNQIIHKPTKKQNISWCNYILYVLLFKSKNSKMKYFEHFRAQILSEENLLQNDFDIEKLLEYCNIKKNNPFKVNIN